MNKNSIKLVALDQMLCSCVMLHVSDMSVLSSAGLCYDGEGDFRTPEQKQNGITWIVDQVDDINNAAVGFIQLICEANLTQNMILHPTDRSQQISQHF